MPFYWKRKALLAKIETTYGVDSIPTGAANAILATDVSLKPMEGQDVSRDLERPFMGAQQDLPVDLHAKLSFKVELQASGTAGTVPAWGVLMRAAACAQTIVAATSVTYNKISTAMESATIYLNIDGIRYAMIGARGTAKLVVSASGIPTIEFEFTGLFVQPITDALPTPTLTGFVPPTVATKANTPVFTVNSVALVLRQFTLDFGNKVEGRFLIGSEGIEITDQEDKVEFTIEQPPLATLNPFTLAAAATLVPVVLTHGTVAGKRVTVNIPQLQIARPKGLQQSQNIVELPLTGKAIPNAGGDQFTLVLT